MINSVLEKLVLTRPGQQRQGDSPEDCLISRRYGVLVVDDEGCVRSLLSLWLRSHGFAVWLAASGQEALDLYRQHRDAIHVVLLDVRMPGMDGPQTLAALRKLNPQVRSCFMSGCLGQYTEEGLRKLEAAAILHKPFHPAEAAQVLWQLASTAD